MAPPADPQTPLADPQTPWLSLRLLWQTRKPLWQTLRPVWHLRIAQISWASDETTLDTVGWLSYSSNWPYDSSSWLSDPSG